MSELGGTNAHGALLVHRGGAAGAGVGTRVALSLTQQSGSARTFDTLASPRIHLFRSQILGLDVPTLAVPCPSGCIGGARPAQVLAHA